MKKTPEQIKEEIEKFISWVQQYRFDVDILWAAAEKKVYVEMGGLLH